MCVIFFGLLRGAFDGNERKWTDLGHDDQKSGEKIGSDSGFVPVLLPVILLGNLCGLFLEFDDLGRSGIRRFVVAM